MPNVHPWVEPSLLAFLLGVGMPCWGVGGRWWQPRFDAMPPVPHRYPFIDALRGFAIAGILLVNIPDITHLGRDVPGPLPDSALLTILYYLVSTRFVPIFAFLFGASLALIRDSAARKGRAAWPVLTRRLVALAGTGLLHQLVYPGEVLTFYALVGLLVLPLVLCLPSRITLGLGLLLALGTYAATGGGPATLPGLFLLGASAVDHHWLDHLEVGDRPIQFTAVCAALATIPAVWWQTTQPGDPRFTLAGGIAGLIMSILYVTVLSLLWQTPLRRPISTAFTPLGRAAFTCYITATLVTVPIGTLLGFNTSNDLAQCLLLAVAILAGQNLFVRLWFSKFIYGPLEWPWRLATWWGKPEPTNPQPETSRNPCPIDPRQEP